MSDSHAIAPVVYLYTECCHAGYLVGINGIKMTTFCLGYYAMHHKIEDTHGLRWFLPDWWQREKIDDPPPIQRYTLVYTYLKMKNICWLWPKLHSMLAGKSSRHVFDRLLLDSKKRGVNPTWQFCGTRSYQTFSQYINSGISWTIVLKCILGSDLKRSRPVNLWSLQQQFDPDNFAPLTWWLTHPQTYCGDLDGIDSSYWAPNRSAVTVVSPPSLCQLQFPTVILAGTW